MIGGIKARFTKGALIPLEPLDLEEGEEVTLSIADQHDANEGPSSLRHVAGAWKGTHDPEELLRNIYADRLYEPRRETRI